MYRCRKMWVGILLGTAVVLGSPAPASAQSSELYLPYLTGNQNYFNYTHVEVSDFASRAVKLVDQQRAQKGCPPVSMNPRLSAVALKHSRDMALNDYFAHARPNEPGPGARIAAGGYDFSMWGENIAIGPLSPEAVVAAWLSSKNHRLIIEDCSFQETGVGYYYLQNDTGSTNFHHYWTQIFAIPR